MRTALAKKTVTSPSTFLHVAPAWMVIRGRTRAYYNYLSQRAAKKIEEHIRLLFNFEFHRIMLENEELGRPKRNQDVVEEFIRTYHLKSISSDALLKNFYRYRQRLCPKIPRKYQKKRGV